jgi:hypothetical protein
MWFLRHGTSNQDRKRSAMIDVILGFIRAIDPSPFNIAIEGRDYNDVFFENMNRRMYWVKDTDLEWLHVTLELCENRPDLTNLCADEDWDYEIEEFLSEWARQFPVEWAQ